MLVLSRKVGEGIVMGGNVRVVVLGIRGNRVRLGVEAPAEVPVHRDEIWEKSHAEADPRRCETDAGSAPLSGCVD